MSPCGGERVVGTMGPSANSFRTNLIATRIVRHVAALMEMKHLAGALQLSRLKTAYSIRCRRGLKSGPWFTL